MDTKVAVYFNGPQLPCCGGEQLEGKLQRRYSARSFRRPLEIATISETAAAVDPRMLSYR